jgi:hypothetical protein
LEMLKEWNLYDDSAKERSDKYLRTLSWKETSWLIHPEWTINKRKAYRMQSSKPWPSL